MGGSFGYRCNVMIDVTINERCVTKQSRSIAHVAFDRTAIRYMQQIFSLSENNIPSHRQTRYGADRFGQRSCISGTEDAFGTTVNMNDRRTFDLEPLCSMKTDKQLSDDNKRSGFGKAMWRIMFDH